MERPTSTLRIDSVVPVTSSPMIEPAVVTPPSLSEPISSPSENWLPVRKIPRPTPTSVRRRLPARIDIKLRSPCTTLRLMRIDWSKTACSKVRVTPGSSASFAGVSRLALISRRLISAVPMMWA